ncbi:propionyl-CoA--succinate CoA transferase, partial [Bacillus xiapuensis]|nr:propionyl-CoA--succinate CoA transferase [Bacillus xiapuensis]
MNIVSEKEKTQTEILSVLFNYHDVIVSMGNGEPDYILSAIDENPNAFTSLRIHQILEMKNRQYIQGEFPNIRYVSYFMNGFARKAYLNGKCDLMPNHFHQMPQLLESVTENPVIVCQTSPMDQDGYFSLGTEADYTAHFIGKASFVIQVNEFVPRTNGENKIHISQVEALIFHNQPLHELPEIPIRDIDQKIAENIAERIDHGSTLQVGIGGIPNAVVGMLRNHRNLGIHTEMMTDGIYDLVNKGFITVTEK